VGTRRLLSALAALTITACDSGNGRRSAPPIDNPGTNVDAGFGSADAAPPRDASITVGGDAGTTNNTPPVAVIQADAASGVAPFTVQLTGVSSSDANGTITAYAWDFGDGTPAGNQAALAHTYFTPGSYIVTLVVTDDAGATGQQQVTITVQSPPPPPPMNRPPTAMATATPLSGQAPLTVQFSAAGSSDPDNDIASYIWSFGDGSSSETGESVSHVYARGGSFTARVTVTDAVHQSASAEVSITVSAPPMPNNPPMAGGTVSTLSGTAPLRVTFDASSSSDPDGDIASYSWSFGDGTPNDARVTGDHVYMSAGMYMMTLTVTDQMGNTDSISATINVEAPVMNSCPTFDAGAVAGTISHQALPEISGMMASRHNPGIVWVHNDSGDFNRIYAVSLQGTVVGAYNLQGTQAVDWEDMAIGPGPTAGQDYIYVGDIGDNGLTSNVAPVYRFAEPQVSPTQPLAIHDVTNVDTIVLRYPNNGAHNVEAMMVDPIEGDIWLVTKHPQGTSTVFSAAAPFSTTQAVPATFVTNLQFPGRGGQEEVTGGDISPDGSQIIVRTYAIAYVWNRAANVSVGDAMGTTVCPVQIRPEPQGEAITFAPDGRGFYTTSEGGGQPIWFFNRTN